MKKNKNNYLTKKVSIHDEIDGYYVDIIYSQNKNSLKLSYNKTTKEIIIINNDIVVCKLLYNEDEENLLLKLCSNLQLDCLIAIDVHNEIIFINKNKSTLRNGDEFYFNTIKGAFININDGSIIEK